MALQLSRPGPRTAAALAALLATLALAGGARAATGLPGGWQKGASLTSWWYDEWEKPASDGALTSLAATGSTDAAFVVTWYMSSPTASSIAPDRLKTPTDRGLERAMARARSLGLRVVLKPHVDVAGGSFRGKIAPASRAAWFASYRAMIARYAALAQRAGAQMLVVGTELDSMASDTAQWAAVIATARAQFTGRLTYAATGIAGARAVRFWDLLDYIGIDAYQALADASNPDPGVEALVAAWYQRGYVDDIAAIQAAYRKPVIFTELGYQSRSGAAVNPWYTPHGQVSQAAQADAYEAAYRVWSQVPWFGGIYWWDWSVGGFDPGDGSFTPRGKAAEQTVRAWNTTPFRPAPVQRPAPARSAAVRPVLALSLDLARPSRATRAAVFTGRVRASGCVPRLTLRIERRAGRSWRRVATLRAVLGRGRRFRVSTRRLRRGSYRARALALGGGCPPARSRAVRFRVG